jgi:hypothetical protein
LPVPTVTASVIFERCRATGLVTPMHGELDEGSGGSDRDLRVPGYPASGSSIGALGHQDVPPIVTGSARKQTKAVWSVVDRQGCGRKYMHLRKSLGRKGENEIGMMN